MTAVGSRRARRRAGASAAVAIALLICLRCALDPLHARRAAATAAAAQDRALTCAAATPAHSPRPTAALAATAQARIHASAPVHYVNLLDHGEDSLLLRMHLIRSAQRSIDLQTFIFAEDDAGYLMLDELVKAARRGVKVRVIVDQLFSLDDTRSAARRWRART